MQYNFDLICRTCSSEENLQSLFIENPIQIIDMLKEIVDLKIYKNDPYPQKICISCLEKLKNAYDFKKQCLNTHMKLEAYLNSSIENINDTEIKFENYLSINDDSIDSNTNVPPIKSKSVNLRENRRSKRKCDRNFKEKSNIDLKIHDEKSNLCNHCGKSFSSRPALILHIRTHTGEKPYKCCTCNKAFIKASALKCHQIIHTGEKPFKCLECDKSFSHASILWNHKKIHTKIKEFRCKFCDKIFTFKVSLKAHERIHTGDKPFKCNVCNQSFRQRPHLKYHSLTHSGEKPFKCMICNKQFTQNGNLTVHMRIHTGEKPFLCTVCDKSFYDSSTMKKHKKKHQ